ncbi:MAG: hypothetical protein D6679_14225 [Candidatus Hydrogenedentota bacterium]|nr:MAG: hypothetical protein D6679_14225 [Candidatus Hydrogenedentota bacterium]
MSSGSMGRIFAALESAKVRYLVVGGVAMVLHGHPRLTADLDLVISLVPENARAALRALAGIGFRPHPPVQPEDLADQKTRAKWIEEKKMRVLTMWNPKDSLTEIEIFVQEPFPFEEAFARRFVARIGKTNVPVTAIEDLIALKRKASRKRDLEDIEVLERIRRLRKSGHV